MKYKLYYLLENFLINLVDANSLIMNNHVLKTEPSILIMKVLF